MSESPLSSESILGGDVFLRMDMNNSAQIEMKVLAHAQREPVNFEL